METKKRLTWEEADEILTVNDLAVLLHLGRNQTYSLCQRPDFPSIKFGRQYRVSKSKLQEWLNTKAENF